MSSFGFVVDVPKNLNKNIDRYIRISEQATTSAVRKTTNDLKASLRGDIERAGMGRKLGNTWRSKTYPEKDVSLNAAGFLWSKAPHIIDAFNTGNVILPKKGKYLAIPTDNVPQYTGFRGGRLTPKNWPERLGKLKLIKTRAGKLLLVTENVRLTPKGNVRALTVRKATKRLGPRTDLKGRTTVIMFVLVPRVQLRKRFDVKSRVEEAFKELPARMLQEKQIRLR